MDETVGWFGKGVVLTQFIAEWTKSPFLSNTQSGTETFVQNSHELFELRIQLATGVDIFSAKLHFVEISCQLLSHHRMGLDYWYDSSCWRLNSGFFCTVQQQEQQEQYQQQQQQQQQQNIS